MSESGLEELSSTGWFNSESDLPGISSVDSTVEPGVIVSSPSASQIHVRALDFECSSAMGLAPNKSNPVGSVPLGEIESCEEENYLDNPIHMPPQSRSPSPQPFHRGWAMGTIGWGEKFYTVSHYQGGGRPS